MSKEKITEFEVGERLDKELARLFPDYSRSSIEKLIDSGAATVNEGSAKTKYKLKAGDVIEVDFHPIDKAAEDIDLPVLYEDENVVVIDKPDGVLSHSKGMFNKEGTVATWLKNHVDDSSDDFWQSNKAGIVHRLDRATSGVMICAKNSDTHRFLQKQFSQRTVKKSYLALIDGELPTEEGLIDVPIERNPKKPATFRGGANGKSAQTNFKVLKNNESGGALVELKPVTGRTHQLRVHLNYLGKPILGDDFYGGKEADRLMLHAHTLEITLPGGIRKIFESKPPKEFNL